MIMSDQNTNSTVAFYGNAEWDFIRLINSSPAEPGYVLPLQTVQIQISWLLKKPTNLDLHFAIKYVNLYQQSGSSNLIG